jgi:hypothetical protein
MRLLCAISHHGLGHLAQAGPVLKAMTQADPRIEWHIWSGLPREVLEGRLGFPFVHRHEAADMGLVMHDALLVDPQASQAALLAFHDRWPERVAQEADWLRREGIQGVISNAAYLPLAAARACDMPAVGFCSLNWRDITQAYLETSEDMAPVLEQMREAYAQASRFLALTPGMPMDWLPNVESAPPVAALGRNQRETLCRRLGLTTDIRLTLMALGGIVYRPRAPLPRLPGNIWLVPDDWRAGADMARDDVLGYGKTCLEFIDLLASADRVITKVGYGSFVEAAGQGKPLLYVDRPDWPETPWLGAWVKQHTRAGAISEAQLCSPAVGTLLAELAMHPPTPPADVSGAPRVAARILELLG